MTRIQLDRGDYFELRALIRDAEVIDLDEIKALERFRRQREAAQQAWRAKFQALAKQHGFDPAAAYRWNDQACELIAEDGDVGSH